MKKIVLPMTLLLLFAAGCAKTDGVRESYPEGVIRLRADVRVAASVKAPVVNAEAFTAQVCGWESASSADLSTTPDWIGTAPIRSGVADMSFDITPLSYYDKTGKTTHIRAWYPLGTLADGKVSYDNPDGAIDVMLTQCVSGTLTSPVSEPIIFNHLTTMLRFEIKSVVWDSSEKITGITLKGISLPCGVDIKAGALLGADAVDFALRGIPPEGVSPQKDTPQAIGETLMIAPTNGSILYIEVTTTKNRYTNIAVTANNQGTYSAGTAYTVTLTFSGYGNSAITVDSSFETWTNGAIGSGNIE